MTPRAGICSSSSTVRGSELGSWPRRARHLRWGRPCTQTSKNAAWLPRQLAAGAAPAKRNTVTPPAHARRDRQARDGRSASTRTLDASERAGRPPCSPATLPLGAVHDNFLMNGSSCSMLTGSATSDRGRGVLRTRGGCGPPLPSDRQGVGAREPRRLRDPVLPPGRYRRNRCCGLRPLRPR